MMRIEFIQKVKMTGQRAGKNRFFQLGFGFDEGMASPPHNCLTPFQPNRILDNFGT